MPLRSSYWICRRCARLCCISLCSCVQAQVRLSIFLANAAGRVHVYVHVHPTSHFSGVSITAIWWGSFWQIGEDGTSVISLSSENFRKAARDLDKNADARPVSLPAPLANTGSSFGPSCWCNSISKILHA